MGRSGAAPGWLARSAQRTSAPAAFLTVRAEGLVVDPASLHDTLFNSVAEAAIVTDAAGRVSAWNARAEFLYGWSPDEALGRPITDLTVPIAGAEDSTADSLRAF